MQYVKITKKTSVNISLKVPPRYIFNSDTSKYAQSHRFLLKSRLSCCKNLDVRSSPGLQRAPMCPCNVRAAGEGVRWAPPIQQILLADSKNGKLGVHFIIDSFLMGREAETELLHGNIYS